MMIYFDKAAKDAKINVSCWLRNEPGAESRGYTLQAIIPTGTGKKWPAISSTVMATDSGWTQISGTIDCSQYKVTGPVGVQIVAGVKYGAFFDYYVDDVLVTTDTDGDLYDDLDYVEEERPDYMSDTPAKASPRYIDIQEYSCNEGCFQGLLQDRRRNSEPKRIRYVKIRTACEKAL